MKKTSAILFIVFLIVCVTYCTQNDSVKISENDWIETQLNIEALYFNSLSFPYSVRVNSVIIDENDKVAYEMIYSSKDYNSFISENPEGTISRDIDIFNKFINVAVQKYGTKFKQEFDYQKDIICRVQIWDTTGKEHKDIAILEDGLFKMIE